LELSLAISLFVPQDVAIRANNEEAMKSNKDFFMQSPIILICKSI